MTGYNTLFRWLFLLLWLVPEMNALAQVHPDAVYPIPNNYGSTIQQGINLFTGDINYTMSLVTVQGRKIAYTLNAFYNSRSAYINNYSSGQSYVSTPLGGYGWKLMDYPKLVKDSNNYFLLDGKRSVQLQVLKSSGSATTYTSGGDNYLWKIVRTGTGTASDQWSITTETGEVFLFDQPGIVSTSTVWNFTKKADAQWGDSLYFNYGGGSNLQFVHNLIGDTLRFIYQQISNRTQLTQITVSKNGSVQKQTNLTYAPYVFNSTTYNLLANVSTASSIAPGILDVAGPGTQFTYISNSQPPLDYNGGALQSITEPSGSTTQYLYISETLFDRMIIYPVVQAAVNTGYNNDSGGVTDPNTYTSYLYNFEHATWGDTRVYAYYNDVQLCPGGMFHSSSHDQEHPYGNSEFYFFTGRPASALEDFPADYDTTLATNPLLLGQFYQTKVNHDTTVHNPNVENASTVYYWQVGWVGTNVGAYQRMGAIREELFGVDRTTRFQYDETIDMPVITITDRTNPQLGSTGTLKDSTKELVTYAFQQYPALGPTNLNILTPVARKINIVKVAGSASWDTLACTATQWTMWDANGNPNASSGKWAEWKNYTMKDSAANTGSVFLPTPNPQQWLKTSEILKRTSTGISCGVMTVDSIFNYTTYSSPKFGDHPIATFTQSNPYAGQSFYFGFEPYESFDVSQQPNAKFDSSTANTGKRNLNVQGFRYSFTPAGTPTKYIVSFWYQTQDAVPTVLYIAKADSQFNRVTLSPTYGAWAYVQSIALNLSPGTTYNVNIIHPSTTLYIDDIRCSPVTYPFSANVYDGNNKAAASLGTNGERNLSVYNRYDEIVASVGPDSARNVRSLFTSYNSQKGNAIFTDSTHFNPNQPNTAMSLNAIAGGFWEGFEFTSTPYFPPAYISNMVIQNGFLLNQGTAANPGVAKYSGTITNANFFVSVEAIPNTLGPGQELGLGITLNNNYTVRFSLTQSQYVLMNEQEDTVYASVLIANVPRSTTLALEVVNSNTLFAYADGRTLFSYTFSGTLGGAPSLISTNPGSYFDNLVVVLDPVTSNTTYDATFNKRQTIKRKDSGEIEIAEHLYGGPLSLNAATTRSAYLNKSDSRFRRSATTTNAGMPLSYVPEFADYDYETMNLDSTSIAAQKFGYANPYTFSKRFEKSPMLLTHTTGSGGEFAADSNATTYHYSSNKGKAFSFQDSTLTSVAIMNPDSLHSHQLSNLDTKLYGQIAMGAGDTVWQQYEYNKALNPGKEYLPNYFPQGLNNKNFYNQSEFDFVGNRISYRTPDGGTKQYIYNDGGKLRFMIDSAGFANSPNNILYWKYDDIGRLVENGYMQQAWNRATLQGYANQRTYPGSTVQGVVWRKRYSYDGNYVSPNIGRLTKVESNNNGDQIVDVTEGFGYDIYNNVVQKSQMTAAYDTSSNIITYQYDLLGKVVQINSGVGQPTVYTYNKLGQIVAIGTTANPTLYATYSYQDTLFNEVLNNGRLARLYDLNPAGWVDTIQDPLFTDSLTYTQGGIDGAGYYSGNIASATAKFRWSGAPQGYTYKYKYDAFGRLTAGYISETDVNDLNYAMYDDNSNISLMQRWKDKTVYWSGVMSGKYILSLANITSMTSPKTVLTSRLYGIAVDPFAKQLYWVNSQLKLQRANLDGSDVATLPVILSMLPGGIAVDAQHQKIYIAVPANGTIVQANLDGTGQTNIVANVNPQNITVDPNGGMIYWPDGNTGTSGTPITIKRANLDGSNVTTLITFPTGAKTISGFGLDTLRKEIYWSTVKLVQRSKYDGSAVDTLFKNGSEIRQISVDMFNRQVFWTEAGNGTLQRINFDKTGQATVVSGLTSPTWVVQNIFSNIYTYYSGTNQLLGTGGQNNQFQYDGNGSIVAAVSKQISSITYDPFTGMPGQIASGVGQIAFQYGSNNQRVLKTVSDTLLQYVHGMNPYPLVEKTKTSSSSQMPLSYVYGPTGLIAINYNNETYFVLKDHLGSVRVVVNSANVVVANLDYTPFGELMPDVTNITAAAPPLRYRYTGQEYDQQSTLYNYRARLYDPDAGRFYSAERASQFPSPYVYVGNNPIVFTDPQGLWDFWSVAGVVVGGALVVAGGVLAVAGAGVALTGIGIPASPFIAVAGLSLSTIGANMMGSSIQAGMYDSDHGSKVVYESALDGYRFSDSQKSQLAQKRKDLGIEGKPKFVRWSGAIGDWGISSSTGVKWPLTYDTKTLPGVGSVTSVDANGRLLAKEVGKPEKLLDIGDYVYIMDMNSAFIYLDVRLTNPNSDNYRVRHSQLASGRAVWAAGHFHVKADHSVEFDNDSGHYKPEKVYLDYAQYVFQVMGARNVSANDKFRN